MHRISFAEQARSVGRPKTSPEFAIDTATGKGSVLKAQAWEQGRAVQTVIKYPSHLQLTVCSRHFAPATGYFWRRSGSQMHFS